MCHNYKYFAISIVPFGNQLGLLLSGPCVLDFQEEFWLLGQSWLSISCPVIRACVPWIFNHFLIGKYSLRSQLSCSNNRSLTIPVFLSWKSTQAEFLPKQMLSPRTGRRATWTFQSVWKKYEAFISNWNNLRNSEFHRVRRADTEPFSNQILPLSKGKLSVQLWSFTDPNPWDGARSHLGPPKGGLLVLPSLPFLLKLHKKAIDSKLSGVINVVQMENIREVKVGCHRAQGALFSRKWKRWLRKIQKYCSCGTDVKLIKLL